MAETTPNVFSLRENQKHRYYFSSTKTNVLCFNCHSLHKQQQTSYF